jgi:hypothetical protein
MASTEHIPPAQRELMVALMTFMHELLNTRLGNDQEDTVMRRVAAEKLREAVHEAAQQGSEVSLAWHTLGTWTEMGKERIGAFSRALDCARADAAARQNPTAKEQWCDVHMEADCLFQIGRVHFHEGAPEAARTFLLQALALAKSADALRPAAKIEHDDCLEGRIAELLLQLPDETDGQS